jgi:hypothetical protein
LSVISLVSFSVILKIHLLSIQLNEEAASLDWTKSRDHAAKYLNINLFDNPTLMLLVASSLASARVLSGACFVGRIQGLWQSCYIYKREMYKAQKLNLIQITMAKQDLFQANVKVVAIPEGHACGSIIKSLILVMVMELKR